jgi:rSAM/selenodomain-associated transferase 2
MVAIAIVIPALNEAANLAATLGSIAIAAADFTDYEVIVVDGGSADATRSIAIDCGAIVVDALTGRAEQLNAGAAKAQSDIILFLHADTRLPLGWPDRVQAALAPATVVAGAFDLAIDSPQWGLRIVEWGVYWRSRLGGLPYGDQGIFLRTAMLAQVGGVPRVAIMEDFILMRRLRRRGKVAIVPAAVMTSGRRWDKLGVVATTLLNQSIVIGFYLGVAPERLRHWYRRWS